MEALTSYIERTLDLHAKIASSAPEHREKIERTLFAETEHPGCLLSGFLLVNRVPGNFHIEARSKYHNLNPTMTNVSHLVHDLTFGPPMTKEYRYERGREGVREGWIARNAAAAPKAWLTKRQFTH